MDDGIPQFVKVSYIGEDADSENNYVWGYFGLYKYVGMIVDNNKPINTPIQKIQRGAIRRLYKAYSFVDWRENDDTDDENGDAYWKVVVIIKPFPFLLPFARKCYIIYFRLFFG